MSYADEILNNTGFKTNIVIDINGTKFAKHQPDSGLVIDSDKLILSSATINPAKVDLKRSVTTVANMSMKILDQDGVFSIFMGQDDNALTGLEVSLFAGRITGSFDFSDYALLKTYVIRDISKSKGFYTVKSTSQTNRMQKPIFRQAGDLNTAMNDNVSTIIIDVGEDVFSNFSLLRVDNEIISYSPGNVTHDSGLNQTTITSITRSAEASVADSHDAGTTVNILEKVVDNPINIILKLWTSGGGGGTYDTLPDGLGIDENLIDITAIETLRDNFHFGELMTLYFSDITNGLKYIQTHLMLTNAVRIVENSADNKLFLAKLDEADLSADLLEIDEASTQAIPTWKTSSRQIQNIVVVKYGWSEGIKKYTRTETFKDDDSILVYGEQKGSELKIRGAQVADDGDAIAEDRANHLLARFSTPMTEISATLFMKNSLVNVGDKIRFINKHLPQQGGGLGLNGIVEILQRGVNYTTGLVKVRLVYTSYASARFGLIQPVSLLSSIIDQKTFSVTDGDCFRVGWTFRLWDTLTNTYLPDAVNEIETINTNQLVFKNDWTTALLITHELHFADFNEATPDQRAKYGFTVDDGLFFDDGSKTYKIIT